jgi:hypothetical protein
MTFILNSKLIPIFLKFYGFFESLFAISKSKKVLVLFVIIFLIIARSIFLASMVKEDSATKYKLYKLLNFRHKLILNLWKNF